jgi:hypothetical protein
VDSFCGYFLLVIVPELEEAAEHFSWVEWYLWKQLLCGG